MDFTFGIITYANTENFIRTIIDSIRIQKIPNYEIIIVGKCNIEDTSLQIIDFDETIRSGWITKKKNIIVKKAKYENIVLLHDYIRLSENWYQGFIKYGSSFDVCVTKVETIEGKRFRDYALYVPGIEPYFQERALLPYTYNPSNEIKKLLYISGAYYIIKKSVALQFPLNEDLLHCQGDDVEYSKLLSKHNIFISCNPFSSVSFLKYKNQSWWEHEMTESDIHLMNSLSADQLEAMSIGQINQLKRVLPTTRL